MLRVVFHWGMPRRIPGRLTRSQENSRSWEIPELLITIMDKLSFYCQPRSIDIIPEQFLDVSEIYNFPSEIRGASLLS